METEITDHCQLFGSVALFAFIVPYFFNNEEKSFHFLPPLYIFAPISPSSLIFRAISSPSSQMYLPSNQIWVESAISMEFLRSFLRRHFSWKPVVASGNVGCFLRLIFPPPLLHNNYMKMECYRRLVSSVGRAPVY